MARGDRGLEVLRLDPKKSYNENLEIATRGGFPYWNGILEYAHSVEQDDYSTIKEMVKEYGSTYWAKKLSCYLGLATEIAAKIASRDAAFFRSLADMLEKRYVEGGEMLAPYVEDWNEQRAFVLKWIGRNHFRFFDNYALSMREIGRLKEETLANKPIDQLDPLPSETISRLKAAFYERFDGDHDTYNKQVNNILDELGLRPQKPSSA